MAAPCISVVAKYRSLFSPCMRLLGHTRNIYSSYTVLQQYKAVSRQMYPVVYPQLQCVSHHSTGPTDATEDRQSQVTTGGTLASCGEDPYAEELEVCLLCRANIPVSYMNPQLLSQFVSPNTGRTYGRHITRLCEMQQKRIEQAIIRSRKNGYMPVMYRETLFLKDPNLFDVKYAGSPDIGAHIKLPGPDSIGEGRPITLVRDSRPSSERQKNVRREKVKLTKAEKRRGTKAKKS